MQDRLFLPSPRRILPLIDHRDAPGSPRQGSCNGRGGRPTGSGEELAWAFLLVGGGIDMSQDKMLDTLHPTPTPLAAVG